MCAITVSGGVQDEDGGDAGCATRILAWNEMDAGWTPKLESWRCSQKAMGFEASMVIAKKKEEEGTRRTRRQGCPADVVEG